MEAVRKIGRYKKIGSSKKILVAKKIAKKKKKGYWYLSQLSKSGNGPELSRVFHNGMIKPLAFASLPIYKLIRQFLTDLQNKLKIMLDQSLFTRSWLRKLNPVL